MTTLVVVVVVVEVVVVEVVVDVVLVEGTLVVEESFDELKAAGGKASIVMTGIAGSATAPRSSFTEGLV